MSDARVALFVCGALALGACSGDGDAPPPPAIELNAEAGEARYALVGELVDFDGSASTGAVKYLWDFGDGQRWDEPRPESGATHGYAAPGRYTAVLTAFDAKGNRRSDSVLISVTHPIAFAPSHSATVEASANEVAVVSPDSNELARFSWDEAGRLALVARTPTGGEPRTVLRWRSWWVVVCQQAAVVSFVAAEPAAASFEVPLPYGSRPYGAAGNDDALFVSLQATGELARIEIDASGDKGTVAERHAGFADARGVAMLPDGRVAVTRWRSPDDRAEIGVLDPETRAVSRWTLAFDDQMGSDTESGGVPSYLNQLLVSPTGREAVVPSLQANIGEGSFVSDAPLSHQTTVRAVISYLDPSTGVESEELRKQLDDRGFAAGGVFSSRGDFLFVAMRGSRTVDRIDVLTGGTSGSIVDVGYALEGVALSPDDRFLFVNAYLSRELVAYDVRDLTAPPVPISRMAIPSSEPLPAQVLRGKQLFNDSFDTRLAKDGYIACAHCHLEGLDDGRVWDFSDRGEGLRNTISLVGGAGAGPLHWSANFDEVQDFEHDIRGPFAGTGLMSDADFFSGTRGQPLGDPKAGLSTDLDALAAYVASLDRYPPSPYRDPDGSLPQAAERGRLLFEDPTIGCTTCHSGPALSDSQWLAPATPLLHDVGTLGPGSGQRLGGPLAGIDTPSLHGVWASPPYLHDGSAATLLDVLTVKNPNDAHGVTSGLSPAQLDDLVAYLLCLDGRVD